MSIAPDAAAAAYPARRFLACVTELLAREGGYVNDPRDRGGCTNRGITRATLERWRHASVTCADVQALTELEARQIYRAWYWNGVQGDALTAGVDLMTFDAAVNSGVPRSARWLQQAVGVEDDGAIGPVTLAAVRAAPAATLIVDLYDARMAFLRASPSWVDYGKGWKNRVDRVMSVAKAMAAGR